MIVFERLKFNLTDFKYDPIRIMEISSLRPAWISKSLLFDDSSFDKKWKGAVDTEKGEFKVYRNQNSFSKVSFSSIIIHGVKNVQSNEIIITLKPSLLHTLNFLFVPIFLFILFEELGLHLFWFFSIFLLYILESFILYKDFKKSILEIHKYMNDLK